MNQELDYKNALYPVLDFINQHYNQSLKPEALERLSFYSYRNLQRIFKSIFGETIGAYQKRIRLENAAKLLHYSDKSITDIALEVGYGDLQAFRKAFKKFFGQSPSQLRPELYGLLDRLHQKKSITQEAVEGLEATEVFLPEQEVVYYKYIGAYDNASLDAAWEELYNACHPAVLKQHSPMSNYGLVYDDPDITAENACRYDFCLPYITGLILENCDIPVGTKKIGGQRYMRFLHRGSYETIDDTYDSIFGGWLLQHQYNFSEDAIVEHYYYNEQHTTHAADFQTFIYVPF